ncbi:hypothetical protein Tco_0049982, partial [Tanacetum coccineum]
MYRYEVRGGRHVSTKYCSSTRWQTRQYEVCWTFQGNKKGWRRCIQARASSEELIRVHNTFHVSNLKKCHADEPLAVHLDGLHFDDKLQFVEEPIEITDREVKRLKRSCIPLVK